jgi:tRNA dimethylallyltransferase
MYFASLTEGLSQIPDPGPEARAEARSLLRQIGPAALHARLVEKDPLTAARLRPTDSQRIARAWEVWRGTGTGLSTWQVARAPPVPWRFAAILLDPPRADLRAAIILRLAAMLDAGAIDEVRSLVAMSLDPALPVMRAHGVPELASHLRGEINLEEATRRIELVTGQYTKRQATWFRHHVLAEPPLSFTIRSLGANISKLSERNSASFLAFIERLG